MDKRLETAIAAAKAGGEVALRYFRGNLEVEYKADRSPVTVADRETERCIVDTLRRAYPDYGVLGEEHGEQSGRGARWIVDPIDGTKSFVRGIPYFATLIGLEEEGEITTGVIYAPAIDDLIYAQKGSGAFDRSGPIRVSTVDRLDAAMLVFGGPSVLRQAGYWSAYERLVDRSRRQRGFGDYFGYTFVHRGQSEAMIDVDLKPWDLAPHKIIVEEAGGRFTDLASNGRVHDEILTVLAPGAETL
jgi:histidinol-phosphatase